MFELMSALEQKLPQRRVKNEPFILVTDFECQQVIIGWSKMFLVVSELFLILLKDRAVTQVWHQSQNSFPRSYVRPLSNLNSSRDVVFNFPLLVVSNTLMAAANVFLANLAVKAVHGILSDERKFTA